MRSQSFLSDASWIISFLFHPLATLVYLVDPSMLAAPQRVPLLRFTSWIIPTMLETVLSIKSKGQRVVGSVFEVISPLFPPAGRTDCICRPHN